MSWSKADRNWPTLAEESREMNTGQDVRGISSVTDLRTEGEFFPSVR